MNERKNERTNERSLFMQHSRITHRTINRHDHDHDMYNIKKIASKQQIVNSVTIRVCKNDLIKAQGAYEI